MNQEKKQEVVSGLEFLTRTSHGEKLQQKFLDNGILPREIKFVTPKPISKLLKKEAGTGRVILAGRIRKNKSNN